MLVIIVNISCYKLNHSHLFRYSNIICFCKYRMTENTEPGWHRPSPPPLIFCWHHRTVPDQLCVSIRTVNAIDFHNRNRKPFILLNPGSGRISVYSDACVIVCIIHNEHLNGFMLLMLLALLVLLAAWCHRNLCRAASDDDGAGVGGVRWDTPTCVHVLYAACDKPGRLEMHTHEQ